MFTLIISLAQSSVHSFFNKPKALSSCRDGSVFRRYALNKHTVRVVPLGGDFSDHFKGCHSVWLLGALSEVLTVKMHWELSSRWSDSLDYRQNFLSFCFSFHSPFLVAFACLLYTVHVSDMFRAQIRAGEEMTTTTVIHRVWMSCVCISFKHMLMTFYKHVWRHSILSLSLSPSLSLAFPFSFLFCVLFFFFFSSPLLLLATQQLGRSADVETEMWVYQTPTWTQKAAVFQSLFKLWFLVCVCRSVYVSWLAHLGMLERERIYHSFFSWKLFFLVFVIVL